MGAARSSDNKMERYGARVYKVRHRRNISEMKNEITSPGGTTAEALYTLEKQSFRTSVNDAIFAAYYKSKKINPMK